MVAPLFALALLLMDHVNVSLSLLKPHSANLDSAHIFVALIDITRNPVSENLSHFLSSHFERRVSVATFAQFPGLFSTLVYVWYLSL